MPTLKSGYYLKDTVSRVPSVTSIIGSRKDCGGLMWWAWDMGKRGLDYKAERDAAANVGTIIHSLCYEFTHGRKPVVPALSQEDLDKVMRGYDAFLEWWKGQNFTIVSAEVPMVSELYRFGGTPDLIVVDGEGLVRMGDYKSGGVYGDALIQVAAYERLWNENHPDMPITGRKDIIRFGKDTGDFVHRSFAELQLGWEQFLRLKDVYEADKILKKRAA